MLLQGEQVKPVFPYMPGGSCLGVQMLFLNQIQKGTDPEKPPEIDFCSPLHLFREWAGKFKRGTREYPAFGYRLC